MTQVEREPKGYLRQDLKDERTKSDVPKGEEVPRERNPHRLRAKCLVLRDNHYLISGSLGVTAKHQTPKEFLLDTGSAYNVIRSNVLPKGWQAFITSSGALPELGDAGGHRIKLAHEVILRVRFGNSLYRVAFLVAEKLSVPIILGTQFANRHVDAIRCIKGRVEFTRDSVPIIGHGNAEKPWTERDALIRQRELLQADADSHDESVVLTRIRLVKPIHIPAFTQCKAHVTTLMQGLIVTEPKHSVAEKYGVRVMNSVHEVRTDEPFVVLMRKFTSKSRLLPKGMIVAYATRSPLALLEVDGQMAADISRSHGVGPESYASVFQEEPLPGMTEAEAVFAFVDESLRNGLDRKKVANLMTTTVDNDDNVPVTQRLSPERVPDIPTMRDVDDDSEDSDPKADKDWRELIDLSHVKDVAFRKKIMSTLEKYAPVFEGKLGTIEATEHRIHLKPGTAPVRMQPYRAGPDQAREDT